MNVSHFSSVINQTKYKINMNLEARIQNLSSISTACGLIKKSGQNTCCPIKLALEPYKIKKSQYSQMGEISLVWQKLLYLASKDNQLIKKTFQQVSKVDDMIKNLYSIFLKSCEAPHQDSLFFSRIDYFKNIKNEFKIIECNVTAVSMHSHSQNFLKAQKLISSQEERNLENNYPKNTPCTDMVDQIAQFYKIKNLKGIFLMIVSSRETNTIEQTNIQVKLLEKGIKSRREKLCTLYPKIQKKGNRIFLENEEISMVYFRAGYQPKDYTEECSKCEQCWAVRQIIELSQAIKIPDVKMQLMNQKRMQVELSKSHVHSKFLTPQECRILEKSLVFTVDFEQNPQNVNYVSFLEEKGIERFILKPNLEGGGNNVYGKNAYDLLKKISEEERKKFILMERIETKPTENTMFLGTQFKTLNCISEVSRYGILAQIDGKIIKNSCDGYLVRVKPQYSDQGGVMAGVGAIAVMAYQD